MQLYKYPVLKTLRYITILLILFTSICQVWAHPIKMTTGKLDIKTQQKTCTLTLNFFIDDFESELLKIFPQPPFNYESPSDEMQNAIQSYVMDNVEISFGENTIALSISNIKKIEDNVCQVTLSGDINNSVLTNVITIKNTLLFPSFNKQSNIIHLYMDGQKKHILQFYKTAPVRTVKL